MAEKKDSIRNLIEQGRRAGKLTSTEISDAMEESSRVIDAEQMEKLYEELESNGIEVVDDDATDMSAVADMGEEGMDDFEDTVTEILALSQDALLQKFHKFAPFPFLD